MEPIEWVHSFPENDETRLEFLNDLSPRRDPADRWVSQDHQDEDCGKIQPAEEMDERNSAASSGRPQGSRVQDIVHQDLEDGQIRLLRLEPHMGRPERGLECTLYPVQLEAAGDYQALSYVWGSSTESDTISVKGQNIQITTNLNSALRALRDATEPRTLWVDALCINCNDSNERSSQVKIMCDIYVGATSVLVWLEGCQMSDHGFFSTRDLISDAIDHSSNACLWHPRTNSCKLPMRPECPPKLQEYLRAKHKFYHCADCFEPCDKDNGRPTTCAAHPFAYGRKNDPYDMAAESPTRYTTAGRVSLSAISAGLVVVLNNYATARGLLADVPTWAVSFLTLLSPNIRHPAGIGICKSTQCTWSEYGLEWLADPSPRMFVLSALGLTLALTTLRHVNRNNRHHSDIVFGCIVLAVLLGWSLGMSLASSALYLVPWAACAGSIACCGFPKQHEKIPEAVDIEKSTRIIDV